MADRRPTVMHLAPDFDASGGQYLLFWLLTADVDSPHRPVVCTFGDGPLRSAFEDAGVATAVIRASGRWGAIAGLRALARSERAELIHTSTPADAPVGISVATIERIPLVHTFHAFPPTGAIIPPPSRSPRDVTRRVRQQAGGLAVRLKASQLIAYSEEVRRAQAWSKGIDPARIEVLHPGLSPARLAPPFGDAARREARASVDLGDDDVVLLAVGRLEEAKGQQLLLEVAVRLVAEQPRLRLLLVGEGEDRALLESQIRSAGLTAHVRLLGRRPDVDALMRASDVFLSASRTEGFGLSVLEAMAAATPVVAFGGPDLAYSQFIDDRKSGRLVSDHTAAALADAVREVLADPDRARALGAGARQVAAAFTAERAAVELAEVHTRVLAGRRRRRWS